MKNKLIKQIKSLLDNYLYIKIDITAFSSVFAEYIVELNFQMIMKEVIIKVNNKFSYFYYSLKDFYSTLLPSLSLMDLFHIKTLLKNKDI